MTIIDWKTSLKFKSDFSMLFEKINKFINLNSIIFSKKGIKISARSTNENLEIIFLKGKKRKKTIRFSVDYKIKKEICIRDNEWEDINKESGIRKKQDINYENLNNKTKFFDLSKKLQSIDFFLEKIVQVN